MEFTRSTWRQQLNFYVIFVDSSAEIFLFTQNRIKKIMQKDTEVGRIAMAVPVIICIFFIQKILQTLPISFYVSGLALQSAILKDFY